MFVKLRIAECVVVRWMARNKSACNECLPLRSPATAGRRWDSCRSVRSSMTFCVTISDTNQSAPLFSFAELVASGSATDSPCQRSLFYTPTSSLRQALHCIGQPLERRDLNFRSVVELRENIETNVFVRIRDHSGYGGNLFRGESIHDVSDMTRRAGIHRLQPPEIRQDTQAGRYVLQ